MTRTCRKRSAAGSKTSRSNRYCQKHLEKVERLVFRTFLRLAFCRPHNYAAPHGPGAVSTPPSKEGVKGALYKGII